MMNYISNEKYKLFSGNWNGIQNVYTYDTYSSWLSVGTAGGMAAERGIKIVIIINNKQRKYIPLQ